MWWKKITLALKTPELRKKILITLGLLAIFRVLAHIPVPGVDRDSLSAFFSQNQVFGLLDVFSGGGLSNLSIVMLGVSPYITSSIIFQLLTRIVPRLETLAKEEGEDGRKKINQYTRWATVPFALIQGYGTLSLFSRSGLDLGQGATGGVLDIGGFALISTLIVITAGSIFLMWLGEIISESGIGNGVSLIIFAGIIAGLPQLVQQSLLSSTSSDYINLIAFAALAIAVVAGVVFMTEAQRNIPVSYTRKYRTGASGSSSSLPLRLNQAGVMPIIFALSVMIFPGVIANFLSGVENQTIARAALTVSDLFNDDLFYGAVYFVMVIVFTFFYTSFTFDPDQIAKNLQRGGGFIPGIRPGKKTIEYLKRVLYRITTVGAVFLGLIAVLPFITQVISDSNAVAIGGTGLLIVVSVLLDVAKKIEGQLVMRDYDNYQSSK